MFAVDSLILSGGLLILLGIASSKFSARMGVPVLVLFLGVGMLAGSEGIGGIAFEDYTLAHGIGTIALAVILLDGGLRTPASSIRLAWKPSLALATIGVLVTSLLTGLAAAYILGIPLPVGILLGGIVGSTDAAAVFAVMRYSGLHVRKHLAATLEIESGSNDPMAIFLTIGLLQVLLGDIETGWDLLWLLVLQVAVGALVGLAVGRVAAWLVNRINLDAAGLYPLFVGACGFLAFGLAALLQGSGFLAIYLAGIVLGNSRLVFQRGILLAHDAAAWLAQIVMFIMLGLLSFPSRLLAVAGQGFLVALVLIFVARPLAVALTLLPFRFSAREITFLSWAGLKGAVPIILATFPLLLGLPGAPLLFNVVFFVVVISALTQGWTLPLVARRLNLEVPARPQPPIMLEISSLRHVDSDIVEYAVEPGSRVAGRRVHELPLPEGVVIAVIARQQQLIPPQGDTRVLPGDHVFLILHPEAQSFVNRVFSPQGSSRPLPSAELKLRGTTTAAELEAFYGIHLGVSAGKTLSQLIQDELDDESLVPGSTIHVGEATLQARHIRNGAVERVALTMKTSG